MRHLIIFHTPQQNDLAERMNKTLSKRQGVYMSHFRFG